MTITDLHCEFAACLGRLLVWATEQGGRIRIAPHGSGLGVDLLLYIDQKQQRNRIAYQFLANYWKHLSPVARWGGDSPPVTLTYFYFDLPPSLEL